MKHVLVSNSLSEIAQALNMLDHPVYEGVVFALSAGSSSADPNFVMVVGDGREYTTPFKQVVKALSYSSLYNSDADADAWVQSIIGAEGMNSIPVDADYLVINPLTPDKDKLQEFTITGEPPYGGPGAHRIVLVFGETEQPNFTEA